MTSTRSDVSLAAFNTFGIDVRARRFSSIGSVADLEVLHGANEWREGPRLILGGGSNVLFTKDFDGLVVRIATRGIVHLGDDGPDRLVAVEAGESWDGLVTRTLEAGWPGLENLALIPGSVGASPVQNIGAYGVELDQRFAWLEAADAETGVVRRMDRDECGFGYRDSVFKRALKDRLIIVRVVFRLPRDWTPCLAYGELRAELSAIDAPSARDVARAVTAIRRRKLPDPAVCGNAGSFFRNPVVGPGEADRLRGLDDGLTIWPQADGRAKVAAARLIERCGWRGRSLGRAGVHDRHALVVVNRGGATGAEVLALARAIQASVEDRFGVTLEPEPSIV